MPDLTLPNIIAGLLVVALNAYVLLGGADYGGGVWDLFASGPRRDRQRTLIGDAIGPVWEANHVWLILAVVLMFTCFPPAFARLTTVLHIPIVVLLIGIVLRGSAFIFRSYDSRRDTVQRRWGRIFAGASVITPVLLGMVIGTIATGRVVPPHGGFADSYLAPWATPFALAVGLMTLALFAFLAAVYLTVEASDAALQDDFRRRASAAGGATLVLAVTALTLAQPAAPRMAAGLIRSGWALPLHGAAALAALLAFAALWWRRFRLARVAAAGLVSLVLWGWAVAQYPYIVPPDLTIAGTAAPRSTLRFVAWGLAAGGAILIPSLVYLFRIFKSERAMRSEAASH
ncbi:MAG: cytochrome d ubiquinol oxidase subunit II [Gemmatimonadota bacterium]